MNKIPYKQYCWSLGTTSFRTKNFNKTIEQQLMLLYDFWNLPENKNKYWEGNNKLQSEYYDFMHKNDFITGEAANKPKDAREKTSGLVDIGLIDEQRRVTEAGLALLSISKIGNFEADNFLQIDKDSFLYLKQLLKTSNNINGEIVRPFIILLYLLSKFDELSLDEYAYLLPLCTSADYTEQIVNGIKAHRAGKVTIDEIIISRLMKMENYQSALKRFLENKVTEDLLCEIGINRKSRNYDKPYFSLYKNLYEVYVGGNLSKLEDVYNATKEVNIGIWWRNYLFNTTSIKAINKNPQKCKNKTIFDNAKAEKDFKVAFFELMHLFKAKATLSDYLDLNRRYIKITNVVLFEDNAVKLDIVPKYFFKPIIDKLYEEAYKASKMLFKNVELEDICRALVFNEKAIVNGVNTEFATKYKTLNEVKYVVERKRYDRLKILIDNKFTDDNLLILLDYFKERKDKEIYQMITDSADIPTIFEYILGIIWYKISERTGKILEYMKLSLDADLLPKTHAAGGEADIVYEYEKTKYYPKHSLLLEATLADSTNQRRMEMEPVSRHLGQHLLNTGNLKSYCVFATTFLHMNVVSDFRMRKDNYYYDSKDPSKFIQGMKIIPLETDDLKNIIIKNKKYKELYGVFENLHNQQLAPYEWRKKLVNIIAN